MVLFIAYGARLSGFLLVREFKNISFKKTDVAKDTLAKNNEKKMPIFVLATIWVFVSVLYVAQVSPMLFRYTNGAEDMIVPIVGFAISIFGLVLETIADNQKSAQKKERPNMVATKGLYKIVRCPNYLGEMIFWTGVLVSGIGAVRGAGQWIVVLIGYVGIIFVMFSGARRLEIRQNKNYGKDPEYQNYVKTVPILLPFIPLYSVEKHKWLVA
jgi:steroid 5-alpha reductase family enzyme